MPTTTRIHNFSAGPAVLPLPVLEEAQRELVSLPGIGMSVIVPSATSLLGARVGDKQRSYVLSRAWMFGIVGFFIGPSLMGGLAEMFGLRWSFVAVAGLVAFTLPAIWALAWRKPRVAVGL